ncbi:hypothetical protein D3C87_1298990 [compost metagenome]
MAGDGDQVGEHRIADSCGDFGVGQSIQADIDDAAFADDLQPIEDRPRIVQVGVVGGQQLRRLATGELFQQGQ